MVTEKIRIGHGQRKKWSNDIEGFCLLFQLHEIAKQGYDLGLTLTCTHELKRQVGVTLQTDTHRMTPGYYFYLE